MTVTTVAIVCDITLADNTEFPSAQIRFTPSQAMIDAAGNDVIPPHPVIVDLNASGVGTANLWPVSAGAVNTHYVVELLALAAGDCGPTRHVFNLGIITPPATGGPFALADLLAQTAGGITVGSVTYATLSDAVAAAVAASSTATTQAGIATGAAADAKLWAAIAAGGDDAAIDALVADLTAIRDATAAYAAVIPTLYATRADFMAAQIAPVVTRSRFVVNGETYAVLRDPAGSIVQTNGERWRPDGEVTPQHFGAVGDGVADDTAAIQAAVAYAFASGIILNWSGDYLTTASIANFHSVEHAGDGRILRAGLAYAVVPTDADTNIIHVAPAGVATNDGLSPSEPMTVWAASSVFKALKSEVLGGQWRLQFAAGAYTDTGLRMADFPVFKRKLQVFGANVDETVSAVPTTIWDGTGNAQAYAFRMDVSATPSVLANLFFKNIKFTNWSAGGIVVWAQGNVLTHNIHADNCPVGMWFRHGYAKCLYGVINNCSTWGIGVQYNGSANIGSLTLGTGVTFTNCGSGVSIGRASICYVQRCDFSGNARNINVEWISRVRTQANTFGACTVDNIRIAGNSLHTGDNGGGFPDVFSAISRTNPYTRSIAGSVNPRISVYGQRSLHNYAGSSGATPTTLFPVATTSQVLLSDGAYGGPDFVPFRIPAYTLYSPTAELEVEIGIALNTNAGGTLALHAQGSSAATKLGEIVIPTAATFRRGILKMKVTGNVNVSTGRFEAFFPTTGAYTESPTPTFNNAAIRDQSESDLLYRLYWTSLTTNTVQFFNMRTYVTE